MTELTEILMRIMNIADRVRHMEQISTVAFAALMVIFVFGVLNCIFGYRLLRFWMMLGGFFVGAAFGFFGVYTMELGEKTAYLAGMLIMGVLFAVIAFLIYKAGVFMLGAGIGWILSIYIIHPTTSAVFFACILIGIALGSLAVKYCREVLIAATSLIGGVMAGVSLARIGGMAEIPFGVGMSFGFAALGVLIQLAINKPVEEEEAEYEEDETEAEEYEEELPEPEEIIDVQEGRQNGKRS